MPDATRTCWVYGVLITDGEGCVRLINPAAVRLFDTDMETALYFSLPAVQE